MRTLLNSFILLFLLLLPDLSWAQNFDALQYRCVGPARGGRVTAVAGTIAAPGTFYLGATGGGVWKTEDYGTTWHNVSDGYFDTPSIGAIAVVQHDPNTIYVGTGSDGLRSNVIVGKGMYKSIDAGKTWEPIGLEETGHIGAVEIHPSNPNIVYVAAIGQAFQANEERGVYKTTDGGKSWKKTLFISNAVGFADLELLPGNPEVIYATAWKAERKPWTIKSGGPAAEGGIYKSVDGGESWTKLTRGLPKGMIGKIDLAVCAADSRVIYALVEAPDKAGGLYRSVDQGRTFQLVSNDKGIRTRPFYYTNVEVDPKNPDVVYVMATGYYRSINGGLTWAKMTPPHGDNHDMWIDPDNPQRFIQGNDGGANVTHNGGKTWSTQFNQPTAEIYQVEVDDQHPYWLYGGQQDNYTTIAVPSLAPNALQADGIGWTINTGGCETGPAVPKPGDPNIVYANCKGRFGVFDKRTGTEKGYYVGAANMYGHNPKDLKFRFQRVSPIHISPHDPSVIYHTSQYVHRTTDEGKTWEIISPDLTAFEPNKQVISGSPITRDITGEEFYSTIYAIRESPLQKGVIWVGANDGPVHVTQNNGQHWEKVTPSKLPPGGRVDAVAPSPHNPAKAYIAVLRYQLGDPKPYIYKTKNYGKSWELLTSGTNGIPDNYPTRVIREDPEKEGLLYAGTEFGVFISFDDGKQWTALQQNLPVTPVTDIKIHRGDLVLSTMGRSFWVLDNITTLRQDAIKSLKEEVVLFQPKDTYRYRHPMIRSDNTSFPQYPQPVVAIDYFLPENADSIIRLDILNERGQLVNTFFNDSSSAAEKVTEDMATNEIVYLVNEELKPDAGLQRFLWDMRHAGPWHKEKNQRYKNGPLAKPGIYTARLTIGDQALEQTFRLLMDPRVEAGGTSTDDIHQQEEMALKLVQLISKARKLEDRLNSAYQEMKEKQRMLSDAEKIRFAALEKVLDQLKTDEGIYPQPMLTNQLGYLYNMIHHADQLPGKDAHERYQALHNHFEALNESLSD